MNGRAKCLAASSLSPHVIGESLQCVPLGAFPGLSRSGSQPRQVLLRPAGEQWGTGPRVWEPRRVPGALAVLVC